MITVKGKIKSGAVLRNVEINLYNTKDVAEELGITVVSVIVAAGKAGVGVKDAGSMFFTQGDIDTLRLRPGRGRPMGTKQEVVHPENIVTVPMPEEPTVEDGSDNILIDFGVGEKEETLPKAAN